MQPHKTSDEILNVFVPTTPNPTSGFLVFAPKDQVTELTMTVEEGLKFAISGGIIAPPYIPEDQNQIEVQSLKDLKESAKV